MTDYLEELKLRKAQLEGSAIDSMAGSTTTRNIYENRMNALLRRKAFLEGLDYDPNIDTKTGLKDYGLRVKMGFASTAEGRLDILKKSGIDAQRLDDGRLVYTNPETGKLTYVDESGLSLADLADYVGLIPEAVGDYAGTAAGGAIGTLVSPGAGTAVGGVTGGAIGSMIGKTAQMGIAKSIDIEEEPDVATELGLSAGASVIGAGVGAVVNKAIAPLKKKIIPGSEEANLLLRSKGSGLTASQMTDSAAVDWIEGIIEGSFGGGPVIVRAKTSQRHAFKSMIDDIVEGLGNNMSDDEVGVLVTKALAGKQDFFMIKIAPSLYRKVDAVAGDAIPQTEAIKDFVTNSLSKLKYTTEVGGKKITKEMMPSTLNPNLRRLYSDVLRLPEEMTWEQAQIIRSRLLTVSREQLQTGQIGTETSRAMQQLVKEFDSSMAEAAKKISGDAYTIWRSVNEIYKQGRELFSDDFIEALARKNPEKIVDAIIKNKNITNMYKVKKILGSTDKEAWDRMGSLYLSKVLDNMRFADVTKTSAAKQLQHKLFTQMGEKSLKMIYDDPIVYKGLKKVVDSAVIAEEKGLSEGAAIAIKLTQFGAAATLMFGGEGRFGKVGSAAVLVGPMMLAKLMTSKKGVQWLSTGLMQDSGSQAAGNAVRSILQFIAKEELKMKQENRRYSREQRKSTTTGSIPY